MNYCQLTFLNEWMRVKKFKIKMLIFSTNEFIFNLIQSELTEEKKTSKQEESLA